MLPLTPYGVFPRVAAVLDFRSPSRIPALFYCDAFCQISRIVRVVALSRGKIVGEKLQRDHVDHRRHERWQRFGYLNDLVRQGSNLVVSLLDERDYPRPPGLHLHYVANDFLVRLVGRGDEHDWKTILYEGDEAVLALASGVRNGWDG